MGVEQKCVPHDFKLKRLICFFLLGSYPVIRSAADRRSQQINSPADYCAPAIPYLLFKESPEITIAQLRDRKTQ